MQFAANLHDVRAGRPDELLPQRDILHGQPPIERDIGEPDCSVIRSIGALTTVLERGVNSECRCTVRVPNEGVRLGGGAYGRIEAKPSQVVTGVIIEFSAYGVPLDADSR